MRHDMKVSKIAKLLIKAYGRPKPFKATNPVDELVRTVLSQNTNDKNSLGAFAALKRDFKDWDKLLNSDLERISWSISHAGLANIKAKRIKEILAEIKRREGRIDLASLKDMSVKDGLVYLRSLKGVGPKTAACVLLFSFGKPVMPVDTHIFRVTKRLGLIGPDTGIEEAHGMLTYVILSEANVASLRMTELTFRSSLLIYEAHLCIIEHGRRTCKAQNPRCGFCALYNICASSDKHLYKGERN